MSKKLENLRENLCGELEKVARKEEISTSDLEIIDKLAHSIKNLDKVMLGNEMIEQYGYDFPSYSGARRGRDGDSDGRYNEGGRRGRSRDGGSYESSYDRSYERSYDGSYDSSYERGRGGRSRESREGGRSRDGSYEYSGDRGYSGHDKEIDRFKMMMQDAVNQL